MWQGSNADEKWAYLFRLDEELLKGEAIASLETCALVQNADIAYCNGAPLAALVLAAVAIESHLRFEADQTAPSGLARLIDSSTLDEDTKEALHGLRKERNRWVHAMEDEEADDWLANDIAGETGLDEAARSALRLLRIVLYDNPWV
ncbi:MAG: hypothetical protein JSS66_08625 [Armatimonadetes bacterium]|nr:hypothetical protein [Armatimonadota bacterium]